MRRSTETVATAVAALLIGCGGPDSAPAPGAADDPDTEVAGSAASAASTDTPAQDTGARSRGAMPMRGGMGEMHARMMGGSSGEAPAVSPVSASAADCPDITQGLVDQGREVFSGAGACYTCHGSDGTGTQLAPDLTDGQWLNVDGSYGAIAEVVRTGVSRPQQYPAPMPPNGGASLSDDLVCAAAAYVYSLSH